jgi:peptidoglycan/LPS O-acetylase OafA/YrhL
MQNGSRPRNSLVAIDLLRFGAAAMVMLCHYFGQWALSVRLGVNGDPTLSGLPSNKWLHSGWVGVEIFFVISGYVIALSATGSTAADFARRRLLRLWPGALVCATITALVLLAAGVPWAQLALPHAGSAMLGLVGDDIDPVYWTLQVECIFYALVAILLATRRWNAARVGVALSFWSLAYLAWILGSSGTAPAVTQLAELLLAPFGAFFGMGILIQQAHRDPTSVKAWMFIPSFVAAPVCIQGFVAADGGVLSFEPLLLFGLGVAVIALSAKLQRPLSSDRLSRCAVALGLATYPLYLLHQFVGEAMLIGAARIGLSPAFMVGPVMLTMIAAALFIALRIEPVLRIRLDRLLRPRIRPAETAAQASVAGSP